MFVLVPSILEVDLNQYRALNSTNFLCSFNFCPTTMEMEKIFIY